MFDIKDFFDIGPFSLKQNQKRNLLRKAFKSLTSFHYKNCIQYQYLLKMQHYRKNYLYEIHEIPFLPVRLFKKYELKSISDENIIKTMTSSGTSGQEVSKIFLDKETSTNQIKVLSKIMSSFIGTKRIPLLIIDSKSVLKDRKLFSARGAGILGFSMLGRDVTFALDNDLNIDFETIRKFLDKHIGQEILLFGFTFIVWDLFYKKLLKSKEKINLEQATLLHGGGWKKLIEQSVSDINFKASLKKLTKIKNVHNYYGMVEQTGSIYVQCEEGHLHSSIYSDIIIRKSDFSIAAHGEKGIIQTLSVLPSSYPGHSLLTEDEGVILGEDDCSCGRLGKYFQVYGRIKKAEIRGCSDTFTR